MPNLNSTHEEADGHVLLHAEHTANEGYEAVMIRSGDTDVFIMCLGFHDRIMVKFFFKCGTQICMRVPDIGKSASTLSENVGRVMIGLHTFTGCDTVSAFAGKGKVSAFQIISANRHTQETFLQL